MYLIGKYSLQKNNMSPGICNGAGINKNAICYRSVTVAPIKSLVINLLLVENLRAPRPFAPHRSGLPASSRRRNDCRLQRRAAETRNN